MPDIGFVNGHFAPLADTMVSVEDRGFQFGDGVYEVIRTYRGVPYQLEAHLTRLARSVRAIELVNPYASSEWARYITQAIDLADYPESKIYLQITRGVAPRDHAFPSSALPTAVLTVREMRPLGPALAANGVSAVTLEDIRWGRCDIKSTNLLPNLLARQRAKVAGAYEAILHRADNVTEGSVSNVMIVRDDTVITPPDGPYILSGVTRSVVLDLARKNGIVVQERSLSLAELCAANEVFLTGTTVEILPVVSLDGVAIRDGKPGPLTCCLRTLFQAALD